MSEVGGTFTVGGESARVEWLTGIMVATVVQFETSEEGTYTIEHEVDGGDPEQLPIHVVVGQP